MRVFKIQDGTYVTVEREYLDVGYDLKLDSTRLHSGLRELFRFWKYIKKYDIMNLEQGLLEANNLDHEVLEFGDKSGTFIYSFNQIGVKKHA